MFDHLKTLSVKMRLFNKQVGDRRFDIVVDDLSPPQTGHCIGCGGDECFEVGARTVGRATEACVDDFLCFNPGGLSTISLRPRSAALSLIVRAGGGKGLGTEGSDKEFSRTEIAKLTSGCARGTKAGAGVPEEDIG
jgi:hypothetical protein